MEMSISFRFIWAVILIRSEAVDRDACMHPRAINLPVNVDIGVYLLFLRKFINKGKKRDQSAHPSCKIVRKPCEYHPAIKTYIDRKLKSIGNNESQISLSGMFGIIPLPIVCKLDGKFQYSLAILV